MSTALGIFGGVRGWWEVWVLLIMWGNHVQIKTELWTTVWIYK